MIMNRKVYIIQPSFRKMNGELVKGWSQVNCSLDVPMMSACIPSEWEKEICLEYFNDVNYGTDASVVIITAPSNDILNAKLIADGFRSRGKKVVFGGFQDTFSIEIMKSACDTIYYGNPGKADVKMLLSDALGNRLEDEYHFGVNIDFPFDYSVFNRKDIRYLQIMASVGCKYRCDYCCHQVQYDGHYTLRDIDVVMEDLRQARKITPYIAFRDANLYNRKSFLLELCKRIQKEGLGIRWGAQTPITVGNDQEVLDAMYNAGCRLLFIGLETLNTRNLRNIHKPFKAETFAPNIRRIQKRGINVAGYFIFGFDHDTTEVFDEVYDFVRDSRLALPLMNIYIPIPGTRLFERMKEEGRLDVPDVETFIDQDPLYSMPCSVAHFDPQNISRKELESGFVDLATRLTTYRQIFRRSVKADSNFLMLLKMNLDQRKEAKRLRAGLRKRKEKRELPIMDDE